MNDKLKIRVMSDLHLEFQNGPDQFVVPELPDDKDTVLILAGDIGLARRPTTYKYFVEDMSYRFREVIYVLGNHEFYGYRFPSTYTKIWSELQDFENVNVLEKEAVWFDGVAFIGATLWTNMDNHNQMTMYDAAAQMNDYGTVRTGPKGCEWQRPLKPKDTIEDFMNARHYIFEEIKIQKYTGKKVVVITHHLPSFESIHGDFKGSNLNGAYASELSSDIVELGDDQPELWIHGHVHDNMDYMIENTRVICNPRGYAPDDLNDNFDVNLVIEV